MATTIKIAAALIDDGAGRMLLVRKSGTTAYMQAGGKIEPGEHAVDALCRELTEELGWSIDAGVPVYLGRFTAQAANEPDCCVEADLFQLTATTPLNAAAEIAEAIWVSADQMRALPLAPLTRDEVAPLFERCLAARNETRGYAWLSRERSCPTPSRWERCLERPS